MDDPGKIAPQRPRTLRAAWCFFFAVMLAYAGVVLRAHNPPPLVDLPDWVYQGVLFHGVLSGHPVAGYTLKPYPIPNSLTTVGLGLLDTVMPWRWAAKLFVVLYLALASFASWAVVSAFGSRNWQLIVAMPAVLFVNLDFWWGHISFEIGLCLTLLLLAMLVRQASAAAVAAMLVLIYFAHMEACAAAMLLAGLWYATAHAWSRLWVVLPTAALTIWYGVARFAGGNIDQRGYRAEDYAYGSGAFLVYKANTFFKTFGYVNARGLGGGSITELLAGRIVFVGLVGCAAVLALLCLWQIVAGLRSGRGLAQDRALGLAVTILLVLALTLPQVTLMVADPGSRLLLLAAAIGFQTADWRGRRGVAIALLSAVFSLVNLYQLAAVERQPRMEGAARNLPGALLQFSHVEPATGIAYYDALDRGEYDLAVFPTALFVHTQQ